jgi:hypothetical protein
MRAISFPSASRRVDVAVCSAREPEHLAVGGDAAHVGLAAARQPPLRDSRRVRKLITEIEPSPRLVT